MKMPASSSLKKAFTLIELLVVIAIIAILMALLLPAVQSAKLSAQKGRVRTELSSMQAAVKHFYSDYQTYPVQVPTAGAGTRKDTVYGLPPGTPAGTMDSYTNRILFNILRGLPGTDGDTDGLTPPGNKYNYKKVVYFEGGDAKNVKDPRGGFVTVDFSAALKVGEYLDPWGYPYVVVVDSDYDDMIDFTGVYSDLPKLKMGAVALSTGKDGGIGTVKAGGAGDGKFTGSDDLGSWQ